MPSALLGPREESGSAKRPDRSVASGARVVPGPVDIRESATREAPSAAS
jgi:hypothetical protein